MTSQAKRFETRGVLAGAYAEKNPKSFLTHAVQVDASGSDVAVLCSRVDLDNLVDSYGMSATESAAVPTCKMCAARLAKIAQ
jgi:hypothetical protein